MTILQGREPTYVSFSSSDLFQYCSFLRCAQECIAKQSRRRGRQVDEPFWEAIFEVIAKNLQRGVETSLGRAGGISEDDFLSPTSEEYQPSPASIMVYFETLSVLATFLVVSSAYTVDPPTTAPSNTITDCTNWAVVASGDTCAALASTNGITLAQFNTYNPSVGSTCVLIIGDSYCVEQNFGIPPVTTTSAGGVTTTSGNGVTTPGPVQTGMIGSCNKFYFVVSGDG